MISTFCPRFVHKVLWSETTFSVGEQRCLCRKKTRQTCHILLVNCRIRAFSNVSKMIAIHVKGCSKEFEIDTLCYYYYLYYRIIAETSVCVDRVPNFWSNASLAFTHKLLVWKFRSHSPVTAGSSCFILGTNPLIDWPINT